MWRFQGDCSKNFKPLCGKPFIQRTHRHHLYGGYMLGYPVDSGARVDIDDPDDWKRAERLVSGRVRRMWGKRAALDGAWDATHLESIMIRQTLSGGGRDEHGFYVRRCMGPSLLHMDRVVVARD